MKTIYCAGSILVHSSIAFTDVPPTPKLLEMERNSNGELQISPAKGGLGDIENSTAVGKISRVRVAHKDAIDGIEVSHADHSSSKVGNMIGKHGADLNIETFDLESDEYLESVDLCFASVSGHNVLVGITFTTTKKQTHSFGRQTDVQVHLSDHGRQIVMLWTIRGTYLDDLGIGTMAIPPQPRQHSQNDSLGEQIQNHTQTLHEKNGPDLTVNGGASENPPTTRWTRVSIGMLAAFAGGFGVWKSFSEKMKNDIWGFVKRIFRKRKSIFQFHLL